MSKTRRVFIPTIKSLSALSPIHSLISPQKIKILDNASSLILRLHSTTAQRAEDPHGADDPNHAPKEGTVPQALGNAAPVYKENPYPYQQRRDGLYENARTVTGEFRQTGDLPHWESTENARYGHCNGEFHQSGDRPHWESTENARYDQNNGGFFQEAPAHRSDGFYRESARGFHPKPDANDMRNRRGFYNNSDRMYRDPNVLSGYIGGDRSNVVAYQDSAGLQRGNPGGFEQEYNGSYQGHQVNAHQNPYDYTREKQRGESVNYPQTPNESNADRSVEFQHHNFGSVNRGAFESPSMHGTNNEMVSTAAGPYGDDENSGVKGTIEELDGFCKEGKIEEAVQVLSLLERRGVALDRVRYLGLIGSCGEYEFLEEARVIHDHMSKVVHLDVGLHNIILDMYSKCGSMADAYKLFERMPNRNLTSWDVMISGLANNGLGEEAIDLFNQLKGTRLKPDAHMFVTIFSACAVLGAVDEGLLHFESMQKDFNIVPGMEHFVGIVDLLGKSGYVDEAVEFIEKMPIEPSIDIWETLMKICRMNGKRNLGDRCAKIVEQIDPSRYTEHAKKGLLHVKTSELAKENKIKKSRSLEVKRIIQTYQAGDRSQPETNEQIRVLTQQMKEAGYVPDTRWVLHDVGPESREEALLCHSERLAVAYGLMTTSARSLVRITKNLRVCVDCHNALKVISKLVGRLILARDAKRWHHFEKGECNCKDYW